jgi:hypothetical protein
MNSRDNLPPSALPLSVGRIRELLHNDPEALVALYRTEFPNGRIASAQYYEQMADQLTRKARAVQRGRTGQ